MVSLAVHSAQGLRARRPAGNAQNQAGPGQLLGASAPLAAPRSGPRGHQGQVAARWVPALCSCACARTGVCGRGGWRVRAPSRGCHQVLAQPLCRERGCLGLAALGSQRALGTEQGLPGSAQQGRKESKDSPRLKEATPLNED